MGLLVITLHTLKVKGGGNRQPYKLTDDVSLASLPGRQEPRAGVRTVASTNPEGGLLGGL